MVTSIAHSAANLMQKAGGYMIPVTQLAPAQASEAGLGQSAAIAGDDDSDFVSIVDDLDEAPDTEAVRGTDMLVDVPASISDVEIAVSDTVIQDTAEALTLSGHGQLTDGMNVGLPAQGISVFSPVLAAMSPTPLSPPLEAVAAPLDTTPETIAQVPLIKAAPVDVPQQTALISTGMSEFLKQAQTMIQQENDSNLFEMPGGLAHLSDVSPHAISRPERPTLQPFVALPSSAATQVSIALTQLSNGPVEITLNPEELGKVSLVLSGPEDALIVTISAEKGETLDLLRRHIPELDSDIRELGYHDVQFEFGSGQENSSTNISTSEINAEMVGDDEPVTQVPQGTVMIAPGLDIRL